MIVRVYWNLHKNCWSVQHKRIVIKHLSSLVLEDVTFVVYESGRQRVLREKKKNVHAFAEGNLVEDNHKKLIIDPTYVSYNPYKFPWFYETKNLNKIEKTDKAYLTQGKQIILL